MKTRNILFAAFLLSITFLAPGLASAADLPDFSQFYTVADPGVNPIQNPPHKDAFILGETPWLYVSFPGVSNGGVFHYALTHNTANNPFPVWIPLTPTFVTLTGTDGAYFHPAPGSVNSAGLWNIYGLGVGNDGNTYQSDWAFTVSGPGVVTPEPLSMTLFALGGLPLGLSLFRRRKTAAEG